MFACNQRYFQLTFQFLDRRGGEEDGIEQHVKHDHNTCACKQRARHIFLRLLDFACNIRRRVPARVRIHHVNQRHGKRRAEDRHRITARGQKADWLLRMDKEAGADQRTDQKQFHEG